MRRENDDELCVKKDLVVAYLKFLCARLEGLRKTTKILRKYVLRSAWPLKIPIPYFLHRKMHLIFKAYYQIVAK
jgi:hypothetical protein